MNDAENEPSADSLPFVPVIIVGAGRSGTNALRDVLTSLPGFGTWPCDEINPIWRHGNVQHSNDEIPATAARPSVRRYIRDAFIKIWRQTDKPRFVVEKTCANSLRVSFVSAVLPEARYIYIVRNGLDVVASARKRWRGELEMPGLPYFLAKVRFVPLADLPLYALSFVKSRLDLLLGRRKQLNTWGPRFDKMEKFSNVSLEEMCARQWAACVLRSDEALAQIENTRVLALRYEDFTANPVATLSAILDFLGVRMSDAMVCTAAGSVRGSSVGKGQELINELPPEIIELMAPALTAHGYSS